MEWGQRPCFLHSDKYRRVAMSPRVHLTNKLRFRGSNYPPKLPPLCLAQRKKGNKKLLSPANASPAHYPLESSWKPRDIISAWLQLRQLWLRVLKNWPKLTPWLNQGAWHS